jgi:glycosyltransferase involved in cell wall biosynthesis
LEDDVIFPGFINENDKPAVYRLAEIFCFPSLYEGFGIPILEAMSTGIPVVASDIPPHREIAENAAIYFNPEKPDDLSEKLVRLLENEELKNNLIRKSREQAQKFSWKKSAQKILEIFKNIPIDNPAKKI